MPGHVKVGGVWKGIQKPYVKQGGLWVPVKEALTKRGGTWEKWFTSAPAAAPAQVTDLQIVSYTPGNPYTIDLAWTPPPGVVDYVLDIFKYTGNTTPVTCFKGATVTNDGSGAQRDYLPTESIVISGAGGMHSYQSAQVSVSQVVLFRLTPRNAIGSATWPSNAPWIMTRSGATEVPLPTPLQTSDIVWSGNSTTANAAVSCSVPTTNVAAWGASRAAFIGPRTANFSGGTAYATDRGQVTLTQPSANFSISTWFPYGVVIAAFSFRGTSNLYNCGNLSLIPGYGIRRVPYAVVSSNKNGANPFTVVAQINTYEGGAFNDVGFTRAGQASNPSNIGSVTPANYTNFGANFPINAIIRSGNLVCDLWIDNPSGIFDAGEIRCVGYGDENELARYVLQTKAAFVLNTGAGNSTWTWTGTVAGSDLAATEPIWGLASGQTYNFYIN